MNQIIDLLKQYYKKIRHYKYRKKVRSEKSKIYFKDEKTSRFQSTRTSAFHFFKTKLEFQNEEKSMKRYYIYYLIIGVFLIVSTVYVMMFTHYFSLKTIDIIRLDENVNIDLANKSIDNFRFQPILLIKKEDLRRNLFSHQPNIKAIQIKKILPSNMKITVSSHENIFQFQFEEKWYIITKNGTLIPKLRDSSLGELEIVGLDNFWIIDYKKYFDENIIANISHIVSAIQNDFSSLEFLWAKYFKKERELHISTNNGLILFHLNQDPSVQIQKLNVFYKEYAQKIKHPFVYIDLRINERIMYCTTETEFQCKQNLTFLYE